MNDPKIEEEIISQDDIDRLLDSSFFEASEEPDEKKKGDVLEMDDLGELSQEDIDSLLGGNGLYEAQGGSSMAPASMDRSEDEQIELISQEDIDRLMNPSDEGSFPVEEDPALNDPDFLDDEDEMITMDDIQGFMDETRGQNTVSSDPPLDEILPEAPEPETADPVSDLLRGEDDPIDAAEAAESAQCLIAQETIDELIHKAPKASAPDVPAPDPGKPDPQSLTGEYDLIPLDGLVSAGDEPDGLDLLNEFDELDEFDEVAGLDRDTPGFDLGKGEDVSQEDIDALLQNSDEEEDFLEDEDDILISQDDIDTLLAAADQEDEDLFGDMMGDELDAGMDDAFDEEDDPGYGREIEIGPKENHVVLERVDDDDGQKNSQGPGKRWIKSRLVMAAACAVLILGIFVPAAYFLLFSTPPPPEEYFIPVVVEEPATDLSKAQEEVAAKASDTAGLGQESSPLLLANPKNPGRMILADFVLLTSDQSKDMAYVTVDIAIDYSDERAYHEVIKNLSFYRDLIYESIQKNLVWEKRNQVTEADLVKEVEILLKQELSADYIEKISFKSFKAI